MRREDLNMGRRDFIIRREISTRINKIKIRRKNDFYLGKGDFNIGRRDYCTLYNAVKRRGKDN